MKRGYDGTDLSRKLRGLMVENNATQQRLAELLAVSRQSVAQYLDGGAQPSIDKLCKLAEHFGCTTDYLLGLSPYRSFQEESELRQSSAGDEDISHLGIGIYRKFKEYEGLIDTVNRHHGSARLDKIICF